MIEVVKAIIEDIGVNEDGTKYRILVKYPEFPAAGGTVQRLSFETTVVEYQAWTPPQGVQKTVENFLLYKYIKPGYDALENIHQQFHPLISKEYWW